MFVAAVLGRHYKRLHIHALARDKGGILISVRWQVTLCDPIWHVSFL